MHPSPAFAFYYETGSHQVAKAGLEFAIPAPSVAQVTVIQVSSILSALKFNDFKSQPIFFKFFFQIPTYY